MEAPHGRASRRKPAFSASALHEYDRFGPGEARSSNVIEIGGSALGGNLGRTFKRSALSPHAAAMAKAPVGRRDESARALPARIPPGRGPASPHQAIPPNCLRCTTG